MKKFVTVLVVLFSALSVLAADFKSGDLWYAITSNKAPYTVKVAKHEDYKNLTSVVIPATVNYGGVEYAVTSVGDNAFTECHALVSAVVPAGVTALGSNVFEACENLTTISLPDGLLTIGMNAFMSCDHLTSIVIPNSVTNIGIYTFNGCTALKSAVLSENLDEIEVGLFSGCEALDYIVIPGNVTSIAKNAFSGCGELDSIRCMSITPAKLANKKNVFSGVDNKIPVYVPCIAGGVSSVAAYCATDWAFWFSNIQEPRPIYKLSLSVNNAAWGSATIGERNTECGVDVLAEAKEHYEFVSWSDSNKLASRTLVLEGDSAVQAVFNPKRYTITAVSTDVKQGTAVGGEAYYLDSLEIKAVAKFGYRFKNWHDGNTQNPRKVLVLGDETYIASFKEAKVEVKRTATVCDKMLFVDPITGEEHKILASDPSSCTWNDSIVGAADGKDTVYTFVVTPWVAPKALTQADLDSIKGAVPVLVPGYEPDTAASVAAIWKYYKTNDTEKLADVTSVTWSYFGKVECGDSTFLMALHVEDTCGNVLKTVCDFSVLDLIAKDTMVVESCEPYEWDVTGLTYDTTGLYVDTIRSSVSCDSVYRVLDLTVWGLDTIRVFDTVCPGTIALNGVLLYKDTMMRARIKNDYGCDEILEKYWHVYDTIPVTVVNKGICAGDTLEWLGEKYWYSVERTDTLVSQYGCDSVVSLILQVWQPSQVTVIQDTICEGQTYVWEWSLNSPFTSSAKDTVTLSTIHGCDSVVVLDLTVMPEVAITEVYDTICYGEAYEWELDTVLLLDGKDFEGTLEVTKTLYTTNGCDSIVKLYLTEMPEILPVVTEDTICAGVPYAWRGQAIAKAGEYIDTIVTEQGCDSIYTLKLHIWPEVATTVVRDTICHGQTYEIGGLEYTSSVATKLSFEDQNGCDSIVELYLTVLPENKDSLVENAYLCYGSNGFQWSANNEIYKTDTFATAVLQDMYGCDSVVFLNLKTLPLITTSVADTICFDESYDWFGNTYNTSGQYEHTLTSVLTGCDSIVVLDLTVLPEILPVVTEDTICAGVPYAWRGQIFNAAGEYTDVVVTEHGCDSIYTLKLFAWPTVAPMEVLDTICHGETYEFGENVYTQSITTTHTFQDVHGCDSIVTLKLHVWPENRDSIVEEAYMCYGVGYYVWNGNVYTKDTFATAVLQDAHGCDSVAFLNLKTLPLITDTVAKTICAGDTYDWFGTLYNTSGLYDYALTSVLTGCDSIVVLNLTLLPEIEMTYENVAVCYGETYTWNGKVYAATGTYVDTLQTVTNGCDSIVTLNLTVMPPSATVVVDTALCYGESYTWDVNGVTYTKSTTQTVVVKDAYGCNQLMKLNLTIWDSVPPTVMRDTVCYGESHSWVVGGNTYKYTGNSVDTIVLADKHGCDSLVILELVELPALVGDTTYRTVCYGDTVEWNGSVYASSGTYSLLMSDKNGCDSTATLVFTVLPEIHPVVTKDTTCAGVPYAWRGQAYSKSGVYSDTVVTKYGCDSIYTLQLHVWPTVAPMEVLDTICHGETYKFGANIYTQSITTTQTFQDVHGCDSIVTLKLHVWPENRDSIVENAYLCYGSGHYVWNGNVYTKDTFATAILQDIHGCDSVAFLNLMTLPLISTSVSDTICAGETYNWFGIEYSTTGMYEHRLTSVQTGCDSVMTLNLTVLPAVRPVVTKDTICAGEPYSWRGQAYSKSGVYSDTVVTKYGCDSIYILQLHVWPTVTPVEIRDTICHGENYKFGGNIYTQSITTTQTFQDIHGCDSIVELYLTVMPNNKDSMIVTEYWCYGMDKFLWEANNEIYTGPTFAKAVLQDANGCDSVVFLNLVSVPLITDTVVKKICAGETYDWCGVEYSTTGMYEHRLTSVLTGCDSIAVLDLTVLPEIIETVIEDTIYQGDVYNWNGTEYRSTGVYTMHETSVYGCDSVVTLKLYVYPMVNVVTTDTICAGDIYIWCDSVFTSTTHISKEVGRDSILTLNLTVVSPIPEVVYDISICEGEKYVWFGVPYTMSTVVRDTLTSVHGCDSVVVLNLSVWPKSEPIVVYDTICHGELYEWEGMLFNDSIEQQLILTDIHGCDSVVTLKLAVLPPVLSEEETIVACDSVEWNGKMYYMSGEYVDTLTSAVGCDSLVTLHLTIHNSAVTHLYDTVCESYTWFTGETFTKSGVYQFDTVTLHGCDSIVKLHLTVGYSAETDEEVAICYGDSLIWNGVVYDTAGVYTAHLKSIYGCDSIAHLHLTILPEMYADTTELHVCPSELPYVWYDQKLTTTGEYIAYEQFVANNSCDSVMHILNFVVKEIATSDTVIEACDSYTWNGRTYTASGVYQFVTTGSNGCDSVAYLHLTVNKSVLVEPEKVTICHNETYTWHGESYNASGKYSITYTNAYGCDSTVQLHLIVLPDMVYEYDTIYACVNELPYKWYNQSLKASGEYVYRETFKGDAFCDSVEHVLTFVISELSLPTSVTTPISICGKPVDMAVANDEIVAYIAAHPTYAHNAMIVWQEWKDGEWTDYSYEPLKGNQDQILMRYEVRTDCGSIASDKMILMVEQATPENSPELANLSVESKYGDLIYLLDVNAFTSTFGWTPSPEDVRWYKVVGDVDVYGENGDDELVGVGHGYNMPNGDVIVGSYYALIEQEIVGVDECERVYRSMIMEATATGTTPKLIPNVVRPNEVLTVKDLDASQIHEILVFSTTGELIATYKADKVSEFMFRANHSLGYYLVDIINENGSTTLRYVVK